MSKAVPQFLMRRMSRRSGDLTRLASQYKAQVNEVTGQYESEYAKYQRGVEELMAPYRAKVEDYRTRLEPAYQAQMQAYNQKLEAHKATLAEIGANPFAEESVPFGGKTDIREYLKDIPEADKWFEKSSPLSKKAVGIRKMPEFTERLPDAPSVPTAPTVAKFDSSAIDAKRAQITQDYNREVSERKGARMNAVSRRGRTLLGGVK